MPQPKKWYPLTDAQQWKKIVEAEDKAILTAYAKAGSAEAQALLDKLNESPK